MTAEKPQPTECERLGHQFYIERQPGWRQPTNACQRPGCDWFRGVKR